MDISDIFPSHFLWYFNLIFQFLNATVNGFFFCKKYISAGKFDVLDMYYPEAKNDVAFSHCEIVNAMLQVSLTSDIIALQQSVDKAEVEFSYLPADDLTSMLATLVVSDL
jgi:hypothetical protein